MQTFTIDSENNITVFSSYKEAKTSDATDAVIFTTEKELGGLAAHWPTHRLVDIWNSLPGATPVKKFTDRKTAIARIWKAIQSLQAVPEVEKKAVPARDVGTGRAAKPKAIPHGGTKGRKPVPSKAKGKAATDGPTDAKESREGSKKAAILALLRKPDGATLKDLMAATGWQAHSVRGFISGAIVKKMGLKVESKKRDDGERTYSLA